MAIDTSTYLFDRIGPSPSALILRAKDHLEHLFNLLIVIGKRELNERDEENDVLRHSVITIGNSLTFCGYRWPKPTDLLGIVLVEILELGEKLWPLREYFSINPFLPTKEQDQIVDEFERELYPERSALALDTERERIATESDKKATEYAILFTKLQQQLSAITELSEKELREMQSRGFEIIHEMIDPRSTVRNRVELVAPAVAIASGCIPEFDGKPTKATGRPLQVMTYFMTRHSATFEALKDYVDEQVEDLTVHTWINRTNLALVDARATWRLKANLRKVIKHQIR